MKVGVLFNTDQNKGGVFQYSMSLINSLKGNDMINELIIYTNNKTFKLEDIEVVYVKYFNFYFYLSLFFGIINIYPRILFRSLDLIVAPSYSPLLFICKPKFIFTLHDLQELYYPEYFTTTVLIWRKFIYKRLTKLAYKIITESNHVKNDIINKYNNANSKVVVIESPPYFTKDKVKKSPYTFPYIFFPAQFWKHKNHLRVIEAFHEISKKHSELKLILTGNKSREYKNIKKKVIDLKLLKSVIFKGSIPQEEMSAYFSYAKLILAPTLYESISIPVFEAFEHKVPVCASGVFAIKDQVDNAGFLFDPVDVRSIVNAINSGLTNEKLRTLYIKNGEKRLEYFSHNRFNKKFNQIIYEN